MSSYARFLRQFTRPAVSEQTRHRTYLHSTDMRSRPSYSVYRSEPVHGSRRRYDSVKFSIGVETRQPRRPAPRSYTRLSVDVEMREPRRTYKNVRFDDSVNYETRYPAQGSSGTRSWSTRDSGIRYETRVPSPIYTGVRGMSCSGRRVLGHRGRDAYCWF